MGRGRSLNHKRKSHPGDFPKGSERKEPKNNIEEDEEYIVTGEAFKNRVEEE